MNYNWTVPTGWSITSGQGTNAVTVTTGATGQNGNITVQHQLVCTTSAPQILAVTVGSASVGGSVSGGTTILLLELTSGLLTLSGQTGTIVRWESSISPFTVWTPISNTTTTYTSGTLTQTTRFRAVVQSGSCPSVNSSPTTVTVNPNLPASVSIAASPTGAICAGTNVTFTATPTNGGTTPAYQWRVNGVNAGTNSATFASTTLANNDVVTVVMTSNASPCLTGSPATSNAITITVNPLPTASIVANSGPFCSAATFSIVGTTGAVVTYNINSGSNATVTLTDGTGTITVTNASATQTLNLVSVTNPTTLCSQVLTDSFTVTVNPLPMASISGNNGPVICSGTNATFTLTGTADAVVTYNINSGSNTTATLTGGTATITIANATQTQTLTLVSVTNPATTCSQTLSGSSTVTIESTTWDGTAWSNGTPTSTKGAIFAANFTIGANFDACNIVVTNNAVVSVSSGFNVNLNQNITVNTGSSFTLNNNANLFQANPLAVNSGNVVVKRQTNPIIRLDYTLWSSPVTGQGLYAFSPFTFANRFYNYNTSTNLYSTSALGMNVTGTNAAGVNGIDQNNVQFETGQGYLIRLPYNHPTAPIVLNGNFTGVPNNGTKTVTLANVSATQQFNLVGNPYPSPISIAQFAIDNAATIEPTLYFWRKTNNTASPSYCTWNSTSQTFGDNGEAFTNSPLGVIQTGQGFFVEAKDGATTLEFNNTQRVANNANQFFRANTATTPSTESNRIWLNLTGVGSEYSQAVVGYFTNATLAAEDYDSKYFNDGPVALNTLIGTTEYVIQGRPTPFQASDVVPLNYKVTTAGNYTFAIDHVDGLFLNGQLIYIKDNQDGSYHNMSTPFTFTSAAGTFANRFELVYQTALSNQDNSFTANSIDVIKQKNEVVINSGSSNYERCNNL